MADAGAAGWVRGVRREGERCGPEGHELPTQATYVYMYVYMCMHMCMCMHVYVCVCACVCYAQALVTSRWAEQQLRAVTRRHTAPRCHRPASLRFTWLADMLSLSGHSEMVRHNDR